MTTSQSETFTTGSIEALNSPSDEPPTKPAHELSLVRQSSIYSLTMDEFQHTLCDPGKNFGSMNMDEFMINVWTAEESQAVAAAMEAAQSHNNRDILHKALIRQATLPRQNSLTLPEPLWRKTVDEVWSEIHKERPSQQSSSINSNLNGVKSVNSPRQITFGEMTLEDFLIRAGVVREGSGPSHHQQQQYQQHHQQKPNYGIFQNNNNGVEPDYGHQMMGFPGHRNTVNGVAGGGFLGVCYGARVGNGGFAAAAQPLSAIGCGSSPLSPGSSDGFCPSQVDTSVSQYGLEMGGMRGGRSRMVDGPVEKVVERRQRRMIKNRESAARSRARKQAYTVELEAELNQLREENTRLKTEQEEAFKKRRKKLLEVMNSKATEVRMLRRTFTGPW